MANYTKIKKEIEREQEKVREQESIISHNNIMSDLDVEMIKEKKTIIITNFKWFFLFFRRLHYLRQIYNFFTRKEINVLNYGNKLKFFTEKKELIMPYWLAKKILRFKEQEQEWTTQE